MKTLLTGFGPFGANQRNSSQLVVEAIATRGKVPGVITEVLPTEFHRAGERIRELIREHRPGRIVCLGLAAGAQVIHLERVALNLDDSQQPDNAGAMPKGRHIIPDAPLAYWSTLPLEAMAEELKARDIPALISNHAGTYVCNHVFYVARHEVELLVPGTPCGFIHLPSISAPKAGLSLKVLVEAVECCLACGTSPMARPESL